ncbi:MAG: acyl-CoA dehydrogenase family protein [Microbacterium sp.]
MSVDVVDATTIVDRVEAVAAEFRAQAEANEQLGRLSDESAALLRRTGLLRHLQPREHGGEEGDPEEFARAVMAVARQDPAAGWVAGVVGVHPWEIGLMDPSLAQEIWGEDADTWVSSPYTPTGIAEPVEGGYRLYGRWQFSSGSDHADWTFLGCLKGNGQGQPAMPPTPLHVVLPREDYTIVPDSWDVIGLKGTGSNDIVVDGAFVPERRTVDFERVVSGVAGEESGRDNPIYRLPFGVIFPVGITGAVIGMAEGALDAYNDYQRERVSAAGVALRDDPYVSYAAGEAASEIHASRVQLLDGIRWAHEAVQEGQALTLEDRARIRRNQIRCAWRAVAAVDQLFSRSGGNAVRTGNTLQRYWRDAHVGLNHFIHVPGALYHASALTQLGIEPPAHLRVGI